MFDHRQRKKLEGRVALITGASRGIGVGIAQCMAREGASVVVNYLRSEESARQVVKKVEGLGAKALAIKADVSDYDQVKSMVDRSLEVFGKADILVNNAGIGGLGKPLIDTTPEEFTEVIDNHLIGSFNCTHALLPHMRHHDRADIQFISSRQTDYHPPNTAAYTSAKSGLEALAKVLAKEERYHGIRINAIAPGIVESDMTREDIQETTGIQDLREVDKGMPFSRILQPEDIGNLCSFLASPEASHISGEVIYVRGAVGAEPPSFYLSGPREY